MPKSENQKLKLLYLMKLFEERTDEEHPIAMTEILSYLEAYGIFAERKSIYSDLEALRVFGMDILKVQKNRNTYYYLGSRRFELPELKLLVDAVQASKFITEKKSGQLIKKLESLTSRHEAGSLQRQVVVTDRIKTMNESIYYNVDAIHNAINNNEQICFQYFRWNTKKEMELRRDGGYYQVSPWALTWTDENYYLVAFDAKEKMIKHFRVDKMLRIHQTGEERNGKEQFSNFDISSYQKKMFGMFGGTQEKVKIRFRNELAGVVLDRFGKEITLKKEDDCHFIIHVDVAVSRQFFAWMIGLGDGAEILAPQRVCEQMREEIARIYQMYQ